MHLQRLMLLIGLYLQILLAFGQPQSSLDKDNTSFAHESFGFASVFHDNMVLQMKPYQAILWGYGTPGAIVNVSLGQDVHSTKVYAGPNLKGIWKIVLKPQPAGGPHTFQGVHDNHGLLNWILLKNVLFGEVWMCGGQSNMQFTVSMGLNATEEVKHAADYSNIRVMTPAQVQSSVPLLDLNSTEQQWSIPSADSIGGPPWTYFSAVCWFYGRYLYENLNVPIGLISLTWGETSINSWMSPRALKKCDLEPEEEEGNVLVQSMLSANNSVIWNAMVHPFLNMTIRGVIWYQDKQDNFENGYTCNFPVMIQDWRESWYEGTQMQTLAVFPFGFVQLSSVNVSDGDDASYPLMRWHQTADYGYVPNLKMPNTFMAVAIDLGDPGSPYGSEHPRDKQDVATRLVRGALNLAQGQDVEYQGPIPEKSTADIENEVVITYKSKSKLKVADRDNFEICCNFSVCGYQQPFNTSDWTVASITSHTHKSVTLDSRVCSEKGGKAAILRYAWQTNACKFKRCSIYNDYGLPAPPCVMLVD